MILTHKSNQRLTMMVIAIAIIQCILYSIPAAADAPSQAPSTALFATDTNVAANVEKAVPGAAAMVDDHIITMDDLILECLRKDRSYVIDQMIQSYVIDRECKKRGITVSEAEIDKRVEDLRKTLAPATLEETLKTHHMSMAELRHTFKKSIATPLLIADQITPKKMIHGREILVKFKKADEPASGINRTEAEAITIVKDIQTQLKQGKDFGILAEQYSESLPTDKKGDLGILYDNMLHEEASLLTTAMALGKGEISQPVKTTDGYCLIQATSTSENHPPSEDSLYKDADQASRKLQAMFLGPKTLVSLIDQSKIALVQDADLIPGKPLPTAAAVVDGHQIPMQDVVAKCLADNGPATVDILVQNYLVDHECKQRGITVSDAEIDQRIDQLREQLKPHTLEEGMALHHTTLDRLRYDFQQENERRKLVIDQVKPTKMVHALTILVKGGSPDAPESASGLAGADPELKKLITDIQNQLKAGKSFEELTKQYSDPNDKSKGGDFGILYEGMHGMDTTILSTALAMKKGDVTLDPHSIRGGYFFLQIISTNDSHAHDEDAAYAAAFTTYREEKAQMLIPRSIVDLLKKSKVVYYVHS